MAGARFELLGVPTSAGAHGPGQEKAPAALRRAGIVEGLRSAGVQVEDAGDLPTIRFQPDPANRKAQSASVVASVARQVADRIEQTVRRGRTPLVLGGECTLTLGVISGLLRDTADDLGLLYLDGDIDLNTPDTTRSGILDNMGIAHIIGAAATPLRDIGPRRPLLPDVRIALFGYDPAEQDAIQLQALASRTIAHYPSTEVHGKPAAIAEEAVAGLTRRAGRVLVHFDVDVVDATELPLADFPHFNAGLSLEEAMTCLQVFLRAPSLAGLVITEINPDHDPEGTVLRDFARRVTAAFR
jgi:arginase